MPKTSSRPTRRAPAKGASAAPRARKTGGKRAPSRTAKTRAPRRASATQSILKRKGRHIAGLPGWDALGGKAVRTPKKGRTAKPRAARAIDRTPRLRSAALLFGACVALTLFVGHTFDTKATLADVRAAETENLRLRLTNQRLRGAFDRMTGPDAVMRRAAEMGLEEGVAYGAPVTLDR